ncbi:dihydropteroate synthase [Helicobacter sp. MIT 14-3879]|uniref:dihydropteroate synthase n=1 Tax=Helicobacter sp. MIT 14-3879 TaxID=2040649 RepID=UPI000E1F8B4A|nr:dihydropteroate synthase [Helicobacter sp. MIT 14-3879]RDU65640.1 dihydropteroate synthase [Helicobacter sp. MIT 14-3879]
MFIQKLENLNLDINATEFAISTALKKSTIHIFKVFQIPLSAAHILKQEALSSGGDFIVSRDMILCRDKFYDGIIIATQSQMEHIINKCNIQPFGLKNLATILKQHLNKPTLKPKIMGIINITDDSFYEDSRVKSTKQIISKIEDMINFGVHIIDIGGASSRPGSKEIEPNIEIDRIKDAVSEIYKQNLTKKAIFSIDSYNYQTAKLCVEFGFKIINDVYGLKDMRLAELAKNNDNKIIIMHNSNIMPHKKNITQSLDEFFTTKIEELASMGIKKEQIILDIGFGFGKNTKENLELIKNLGHFKHFDCEILVGASRKRSIGEITNKDTKDRLSGTLSLHQRALDNGANIIRCHDYKEHIDMFAIWQELNAKQ